MIKKIINKLKSLLQQKEYFVIIDETDNSITISEHLFKHIKQNLKDEEVANAFVFKTGHNFAFMINPAIEQPTQLCPIQYNGQYKAIGFQSLCPSVTRIAYEYKIPYLRKTKLTITIQKTIDNKIYYQIERPQ